ncbi:amidohydrolase [Streptomyces sp. NPDC048282]|uniref:amidohydrolase n=1 Tax=unclassified Streptomyces TaxID=2593676 RepID=UPI0037127894
MSERSTLRRWGLVASVSCLTVSATVLALTDEPSAAVRADTVFLHGQVLLYPESGNLMSHEVDWASAVAVKDGRIAYVGGDHDARRLIGPRTRVIDLNGRILMPGLGDGHFHSGASGTCVMNYEGGTVEAVLAKLKACLLRDDQAKYLKTDSVLSASQFNGNGMLPHGTTLTRHELDRLSKDPSEDEFGTGTTRPIVIGDMGEHQTFTNTKAIRNAGLDADTPAPPGGFIGRDADGYPNGQFADYSGDWGPYPEDSGPDAGGGAAKDYRNANRVGITSLLHPGFGVSDELKQLAKQGKLTVRVNQALAGDAFRGETDPKALDQAVAELNAVRAEYDGYRDPASPGDITVDTVKIFCDGVAEYPGQTAAMIDPYRKNIGTREKPEFVPGDRRGEDPSCSDSAAGFKKLDEAHWSIHVHAIGDRAVREALDNFAANKAHNPSWDRRATIAHDEFVRDSDIPRFGKLGVVASMSPVWFERNMWTVDATEGYVAPKSMAEIYPAGRLVRSGAVLAFGNDWPATPPWRPWTGIEEATTREGRPDPKRAIYPGRLGEHNMVTFPQAVKAATIGVAYQMHRDDEVGSIAKGKLADLIVIDRDLRKLFDVSPALRKGDPKARTEHMKQVSDANVAATKTLLTMVGGKVVYSDPKFKGALG